MKKLRKVSPGSRLMIVMTKVLADSVRDVPYKDQNRIPTPKSPESHFVTRSNRSNQQESQRLKDQPRKSLGSLV